LKLPAEGWGVELASRQPEVGKKAGGLREVEGGVERLKL